MAIRAHDPRVWLIVANNFLTEQVDTLTKELDWAWHWISPGYTRSANRRR